MRVRSTLSCRATSVGRRVGSVHQEELVSEVDLVVGIDEGLLHAFKLLVYLVKPPVHLLKSFVHATTEVVDAFVGGIQVLIEHLN